MSGFFDLISATAALVGYLLGFPLASSLPPTDPRFLALEDAPSEATAAAVASSGAAAAALPGSASKSPKRSGTSATISFKKSNRGSVVTQRLLKWSFHFAITDS